MIKKINHFLASTLVEDKPDLIIKHVECNEVTKQNMNTVNQVNLVTTLLILGNYVLVIMSILPKCSIKLTKIIREVNDTLK